MVVAFFLVVPVRSSLHVLVVVVVISYFQHQASICSRIDRTHHCHGRMTAFEEAFSFPVSLDGIREAREVLHVPVCGVVSMSERLTIHTAPFNKNRHVFIALFADETSQKHVSLSGPILSSVSGKNGNVGIVTMV